MPDFAGSKTQWVNKYAVLRAPQTPPPGLQPGLHRKTTFCFSASPAGNTITPNIPRQSASSLPVSSGNNLSSTVILFTEQISIFHQPTPSFRLARPTPSRPSSLQSKSQPSLSQHPTFRLVRPTLPRRPSFHTRSHNLPQASTRQQPADVICRLPIPSPLHFSVLFFFFLFSSLFFFFPFFSYFSGIILNTGSSSTGSSGL